MKILKQYRFSLILFLVIVALVLLRSFNPAGFRYDAARWAEASVDGSNILTIDQVSALEGEVMLLNLESESELPGTFKAKTVAVAPEALADKEILKNIRKHRGPVILYSANGSVSSGSG
jgi:hypothetical protein